VRREGAVRKRRIPREPRREVQGLPRGFREYSFCRRARRSSVDPVAGDDRTVCATLHTSASISGPFLPDPHASYDPSTNSFLSPINPALKRAYYKVRSNLQFIHGEVRGIGNKIAIEIREP